MPGGGRVLGSGPCGGLCQWLDRAAALAAPGARPRLRRPAISASAPARSSRLGGARSHRAAALSYVFCSEGGRHHEGNGHQPDLVPPGRDIAARPGRSPSAPAGPRGDPHPHLGVRRLPYRTGRDRGADRPAADPCRSGSRGGRAGGQARGRGDSVSHRGAAGGRLDPSLVRGGGREPEPQLPGDGPGCRWRLCRVHDGARGLCLLRSRRPSPTPTLHPCCAPGPWATARSS